MIDDYYFKLFYYYYYFCLYINNINTEKKHSVRVSEREREREQASIREVSLTNKEKRHTHTWPIVCLLFNSINNNNNNIIIILSTILYRNSKMSTKWKMKKNGFDH